MGLNSRQLDENGNARCIVCGKKVPVSRVASCVRCDRFACKSCTVNVSGSPVCKKCK